MFSILDIIVSHTLRVILVLVTPSWLEPEVWHLGKTVWMGISNLAEVACWCLFFRFLQWIGIQDKPWYVWRQVRGEESESCSVVSDSLLPHGLFSPWNSPGQDTGVSSFSLFQGIFPTQGSNPCLPHCRWILYQLSHQESPGEKERKGYLFIHI